VEPVIQFDARSGVPKSLQIKMDFRLRGNDDV